MEGVAILTAVLAVATVTASNDYSKEQQFRALNAVKEDILIKVPTPPPFLPPSLPSYASYSQAPYLTPFLTFSSLPSSLPPSYRSDATGT